MPARACMCVVATALFLAVIPCVAGAARASDDAVARVQALLHAYPDFLDRVEDGILVWKDGTRMPIDDGKGTKDQTDLLNRPDIADMFAVAYPLRSEIAPERDSDPGRYRYVPLFEKMYGDCEKNEVAPKLVDVEWLPSRGRQTIKMTRVNGVADQLRKVSQELDALPEGFTDFLMPLPETNSYHCRDIAGTERSSAHRFGIAIDINVNLAQYWRWTRADQDGSIPYQNKIPMEIVEIFERHGFIWGGRWYHYDTPHFEYRPELLLDSARATTPP